MADIHHQEKLDTLDKLSVSGYRSGITLISLALLLCPLKPEIAVPLLAFATFLSAANLHVYLKGIRMIIQTSAWLGLLILPFGPEWLAMGLMFVCWSGVALKESFCFKVPGLKLVPLLLAASTAAIALQNVLMIKVLLWPAAFIMGWLAMNKWRMPLHFDIGDKSKYQI